MTTDKDINLLPKRVQILKIEQPYQPSGIPDLIVPMDTLIIERNNNKQDGGSNKKDVYYSKYRQYKERYLRMKCK